MAVALSKLARHERRRDLARRLDVGDHPSAAAKGDWPIAPVLAAFALGWLAFAWPWLSGSVTIPWDAKAQFAPQIQFMAQTIWRGESPFWQPYAFSGVPQIADPQSMLFSPPFMVLAAINPNPSLWAIDVTVMLSLLFIGWSVIWLARDLGWHWGGALVAALALCFGASMAWRLQHFGQVLSLGYVPLAMLCLRRAILRGSIGWGIAAGVTGAAIVLGRDQVALLAVYVLALYALWTILEADRWGPALRRAFWPLAAGAVVAIILAALPLWLTSLYAATSNRPAIDFISAGRGSLHPALGLTLVAPHLFGAAGKMEDYWGPPSFTWTETDLFIAQNMGVLYLSLPVLMLLAAGMIRGVIFAREARFLTLILVLATLYALGWFTPVFRLCYDLLPGVGYFRRPADATFLVGGFGALLAGYVANRWLSDRLPQASRTTHAIEMAATVTGFVVAILVARQFGRLDVAVRPLAFAGIWLGVAVLGLVTVEYLRIVRPALAGALLAGLVAVDLAANNGPNGATALPPSPWGLDVLRPETKSPTIALLKAKVAETTTDTMRPRVELTGLGFHSPNAAIVHRLESVSGYNPVFPGLYGEATGIGDSTGGGRTFSPAMPSYHSTLANLLGLRFIALGRRIETIDPRFADGDLASRGFTLIDATADGFVYENRGALPRVLYATGLEPASFDDIVRTGQWPAVDYAQTVLVEGRRQERAVTTSPSSVRIVSYRTTEVVVEADGPGGMVVLNDMWQPWWTATIDGQPAAIERVNVLFRGVPVVAGKRRVVFKFSLAAAFQRGK